MAIDTENKRRSAGSHFSLTVLPVPDGAITGMDRPHVGFVYRGSTNLSVPALCASADVLERLQGEIDVHGC